MDKEIPHATPEVEGPNSFPTGIRFDTSTESYADGWPPTPTVTQSSERARKRLLDIDRSVTEASADELPAVIIEPLGPTGPQPEVDQWIAKTERENSTNRRRARSAVFMSEVSRRDITPHNQD